MAGARRNGNAAPIVGLQLRHHQVAVTARMHRFQPVADSEAVLDGDPRPAVRYLQHVAHVLVAVDSEDIDGTLLEQYQRSFAFIRRNLRHVQGERGFNTLGLLEIPEQALEELLVNALIHRAYFTSASIRLMIFADRVEIISPGHLPDRLSTAAIRRGATNRRNPTLTEHAVHILPYRGLGTGIPRALQDWPAIELIDDVAANQFRVVIQRRVSMGVTPEVARLLAVVQGEMKRAEIQAILGLKDEKHFRVNYLHPALEGKFIEMTIPDKSGGNSQIQRTASINGITLNSREAASMTIDAGYWRCLVGRNIRKLIAGWKLEGA